VAQIYKFFNALEISPGVYDREYQASDFADFFGDILSTGLLHKNHVPGLDIRVETGTMNVIISAGKAVLKGYPYENTSDYTLVPNIAEATRDRIDRIVLRLDLRTSERNILLHVKEGIPSDNPIPPVLQRDDYIHELSLAQIKIRKNTVQLFPEDLIDERPDPDLCGLSVSLISIPPEPDHLINSSIYRLDKDKDYNFVTVERKRPDGTLLERATLSSPDSEGKYRVRTVQKFSRSGLVVTETIVYDLHYDNEGYLVGEVLRND